MSANPCIQSNEYYITWLSPTKATASSHIFCFCSPLYCLSCSLFIQIPMHLCTAAIDLIWLTPPMSVSHPSVSVCFLSVAPCFFIIISLFLTSLLPKLSWVELGWVLHCEWEKSVCLLRRTTCFQLCGPSIPHWQSDGLMSTKKRERDRQKRENQSKQEK